MTYKTFQPGEVLTALDVQTIQDQTIIPVADQTERDGIPATDGMTIYRADLGRIEQYRAGRWRPLDTTRVVVAERNFSNLSEVIFDNVFTDDYTRYEIELRTRTSVVGMYGAVLRAAGADLTGAHGNSRLWQSAAAAVTAAYASSSSWTFTGNHGNVQSGSLALSGLTDPNEYPMGEGMFSASGGTAGGASVSINQWAGLYGALGVVDGIRLFMPSGTMSGRITIVGIR